MKLTKAHKAEFVRAVLADVPTKNYPTQAEDLARKMCFAKYKELGIDKVDARRLAHAGFYVSVWKDATADTMVASKPNNTSYRLYSRNSFAHFAGKGLTDSEIDEITDCSEMMVIRQGYADELNMLNSLRKQLTAAIDTCSTLKQAKEALPEFVKYLPGEPGNAIDRTLPVVGNLVADLMKVGWPKKDPKQ
jgi:hypothetical protein